MARGRWIWLLVLALGVAGSASAQEAEKPASTPKAEKKEGEEKEKGYEYPAPFDDLAERFNFARVQRRLDLRRRRDVTYTDKPQAAEFPLAVFVESVRPLGSLKYENQLNYLTANFTGDARPLQTMTYEYVFADWHAVRFELVAPDGRLDAIGLGYQQTLRVGPDGNWADGFLLLPEFATTGSGFVGGTALYTAIWKPERESPWSVSGSLGANRASFENRPIGGSTGGVGSMAEHLPGGSAIERGGEETRVWRPFAALNGWYTFNPQWTVGFEVDTYPHDRFGETLIQPNLTWRPVKHFFLQLGAGYYEASGHGQAAFMCRVNLLNPSPRKPREK